MRDIRFSVWNNNSEEYKRNNKLVRYFAGRRNLGRLGQQPTCSQLGSCYVLETAGVVLHIALLEPMDEEIMELETRVQTLLDRTSMILLIETQQRLIHILKIPPMIWQCSV